MGEERIKEEQEMVSSREFAVREDEREWLQGLSGIKQEPKKKNRVLLNSFQSSEFLDAIS